MALHRVLAGAATLVLLAAAVWTVSTIVSGLSNAAGVTEADAGRRCDASGFRRSDWRSRGSADSRRGGLSRRQEIADRLVECKTLLGESYEAVAKLLGKPDDGSKRQRSLSYLLGDERGLFKLDSEFLDIELDASYRVVRATVG
jgi:hypothetical protein